MTSRLPAIGVICAFALALVWAWFLAAIVGFGKGMAGARPSAADYLGVYLWPGSLGFVALGALGFAAWRSRVAAWIAIIAATIAGLLALWLFL